MTQEPFIPYFRMSVGEEEIRAVTDTLKSGWLTMGPKTFEFEEKMKEYFGTKEAIAVDSCTSALFLSLKALDIGSGDEVITTPFTFAASVNAIIHTGATPVFVDIRPDLMTIDPQKIEEAITSKTKAILPVHYGGIPCDLKEINQLAAKHNLHVVEDAAHALGSAYNQQWIGLSGNTVCFSFYANKNITTGEGGMIFTQSSELAEKLRLIRWHGISKDSWDRYQEKGSWYYEVLLPGYKCNMSDLQASLGIEQLKKEQEFRLRRKEISRFYHNTLQNSGLILSPELSNYDSSSHLFTIRLAKNTIPRDRFQNRLKELGIGTSVHFIPVHLHPWYRENLGTKRGDFPNAEEVYDGIISLPVYPDLTLQEAERVVRAVNTVIAEG